MEILADTMPNGWTIFDGRTGTALVSNPEGGRYSFYHTYPTIADADLDGHAEFFVTSASTSYPPLLSAWEHDGAGWAGAGPTWPMHFYTETNIEEDGHVPAAPTPYWLASGYVHGRTAYPRPDTSDLYVAAVDTCVADCAIGPARVSVQVANHGAVAADAGLVLSVYTDTDPPVLVKTSTLPEVPAGQSVDSIVIDLPLASVAGVALRVVVDDDGTGKSGVTECDEDNNAWVTEPIGCR
jgi:hypothetical protein